MDYYVKLTGMSESELDAEIKKLNDMLFKMNPASPMFEQVRDMLAQATAQYGENIFLERSKNKLKDEALEIGSISSDVIEPDYSSEELLLAVVTSYTANTNISSGNE